MSTSQRRYRALLGRYVDVSVETGVASAEYEAQPSPDADGLWWVGLQRPTGLEITVGMKPEYRIDAVLNFASHAPVEIPGASRIDGVEYIHRAVLPRDHGRDELLVLAETSQDALTISDGSGIYS